MLWKYCTQYPRTFGKLSNGHRTGKGQFSFQSQRKAMPAIYGVTQSQIWLKRLSVSSSRVHHVKWWTGEAQAEIKIAGRNIKNLKYVDDTTLMAESKEKLKNLLMKVKEESGKSWLKTQHSENEDHGIWSHHFTANRWENDGNSDTVFLGSKSLQMVTAAMKLKDACSLEEKLWQTWTAY